LQSLRVVDQLEARYPTFNGLNLCFETREGILKHCSVNNAQALEKNEPHGVGYRFIHRMQPSLEAQLCNLADEIAYNAHDIDDGVRSGLLSLEQLQEVPLFNRYHEQVEQEFPQLQGRRLLYESIRRMLSDQVYDTIQATRSAIDQAQIKNIDQVRQASALVQFNSLMKTQSLELKQFLLKNLYRHPQVMSTTDWAKNVVVDLFNHYLNMPQDMPTEYASNPELPRAVADYLSGMTDRFASKEHARLTGST
jgi:dGTPase